MRSRRSSRGGRGVRFAFAAAVVVVLCSAQAPVQTPDASVSPDAEAIPPPGPPPPGFRSEEQKAAVTWGPQMMWQQSKAEAQMKRAASQARDVEILKSQLIQQRFDDLDDTAASKNWEGRPPKPKSRDWEAYQEWKFLKEHLEALKEGRRPKRSAPDKYRPKWLSE